MHPVRPSAPIGNDSGGEVIPEGKFAVMLAGHMFQVESFCRKGCCCVGMRIFIAKGSELGPGNGGLEIAEAVAALAFFALALLRPAPGAVLFDRVRLGRAVLVVPDGCCLLPVVTIVLSPGMLIKCLSAVIPALPSDRTVTPFECIDVAPVTDGIAEVPKKIEEPNDRQLLVGAV